MLSDNLFPFIDILRANEQTNAIYQQDDATPHSCTVTKKWLQGKARKHGISIMELRANSGDLNPIEHLWSYI